MATVIEAAGLSKDYGRSCVVRDLSLRIEEGSVYGFIGPNGAGKTTTIAMLTGILRPNRGEVRLFGKTLKPFETQLRKNIGVVPDNPYVYGYMSATEYLAFFAELYGANGAAARIEELLAYFNLTEDAGKQLKKYSKGMKQKINIARALLHDPDILFLDEPIQGLDPASVKEVRDLILSEKKRGKTVFISSHILAEMDKVCDHVGIINKGALVMSGSIDEIRRSLKAGRVIVIEAEGVTGKLIASLEGIDSIAEARRDGNMITVRTAGPADRRRDISRAITREGGIILSMKEEGIDLETAYVEMTGGGKA